MDPATFTAYGVWIVAGIVAAAVVVALLMAVGELVRVVGSAVGLGGN